MLRDAQQLTAAERSHLQYSATGGGAFRINRCSNRFISARAVTAVPSVEGHSMSPKSTRRIVLIALLLFTPLGYCSAAVSLSRCDAHVSGWLPQDAAPGSTRHSNHAEPASMFLPFLATVSFQKRCLLAPPVNQVRQLERGTRYYLTIFGVVIPFWTASNTTTIVS